MTASTAASDSLGVRKPDVYNLGSLVDRQIPETVHAFTRRDTALCALSVGVGSDRLDTRTHDFADP